MQRTPPKAVERDRLSWLQFAAEPTRYDRMPFRKCGASGLKLPAISLGAWETFGGYRGPETARECIFRAFNLGVTHFDLANNYGKQPGRAETVVGRILCEMPREELIVSTKAGSPMWAGPHGRGCSRKSLLVSIDESLQRLGLDYIDIFYAHGPDKDTPLEETLAAFDHIVRQGKALWVGLSNHAGRAIEEAAGIARHFQTTPVVAAQAVYNLLNRRIEAEVLPSAQTARCGVLACSPLAQGILSDKYLAGIPEDSRASKLWDETQRSRITRPLLDRVGRLNEMAKARGQTLPQLAIAWVLRRPEVTSVLMGASDVDQVEENVRALDNLRFSAEELTRIDEILQA